MEGKLKKSAEELPRRLQEFSKGSHDVCNRTRKHVCMCGLNDCKKVMQRYSCLDSLYGHWVKLPSYLPTKTHSDLKKVKSHNVRRAGFCTSLSVSCPVAGSGKDWYVAMHHFHPVVVNFYRAHDKKKTNFPHYVPLSVGARVYERNMRDKDSGKYVTLPNYPMTKVREDLQRLEAAFRTEGGANYRSRPNESTLHRTLKDYSTRDLSIGLTLAAEEIDTQNDIAIREMKEKHTRELAAIRSLGLSRRNLMSKSWYARNPHAAQHYYGFKSFEETIFYCHALFETPVDAVMDKDYEAGLFSGPLTQLEKMLAVKMLIHRNFTNHHIGHIWGVSYAAVSSFLKLYMPLWGESGEDLSTLDINEEFIDKDQSDKYTGELRSVSCLDDGKIIMTDTFRKNSMFTQAQFSNKVHHPGLLFITWTTPGGLAFESTPVVLGRSSEGANVRHWGEHLGFTPCRDENTRELSLGTAFCFQNDGVNELPMVDVADGDENDATSLTDDILQYLHQIQAAEELEDRIDTASDEDKSDDEEEVDGDCEEMWEWYSSHAPTTPTTGLSGVKHTKCSIIKACDDLRSGGPDSSSSRKLKQLMRHERLHELYSNEYLAPCHLSFFLPAPLHVE